MPIYEYVCSACSHRTDILHGVNEGGPLFCPACGAEGTMRKAFAPPAIHFKGSGWAKKDRGAASRTKAGAKDEGAGNDRKAGESGASATSSAASDSSAVAKGPAGASTSSSSSSSSASSDD